MIIQKEQLTSKAFTLLEIIIVVVILGVIAGLGLNNYYKVVEQGYCRNAQMNLITIYRAAEIKFIKTKSYALSGTNLTAINNDLGLNITDPKFTYTYTNGPLAFSAQATRTGGPNYMCATDCPSPLRPNFNPVCTSATFCQTVLQP